jgi:hypothetical protein
MEELIARHLVRPQQHQIFRANVTMALEFQRHTVASRIARAQQVSNRFSTSARG